MKFGGHNDAHGINFIQQFATVSVGRAVATFFGDSLGGSLIDINYADKIYIG